VQGGRWLSADARFTKNQKMKEPNNVISKRQATRTSHGVSLRAVAGRIGLSIVVVAAVAGCHDGELKTSTTVQTEAMAKGRAQSGRYGTNMVDNAILHDMSISDIHFIAHSKELSGTGVARLDRMAMLLDTYGGTVHFETVLTDEDMIAARLDHVREYLEVVGCDMSKVELAVGPSGGRGMPARDALEGEDRVTTHGEQGNASIIPAGFGGSGQ
jgi:hypothetical protein